jgi:pantetheine-phosphate adenylyltransferase
MIIVPGSYDPVTLGHLDVIERAYGMYGSAHAVIFVNPKKVYTFSVEERLEMLRLATAHLSGVTVDFSDGYVVDYMKKHSLYKIVKGYRNVNDLDYERMQADYNFEHGGFETEFLPANESRRDISSTLAREIIARGGDLQGILPSPCIAYLREKGYIK